MGGSKICYIYFVLSQAIWGVLPAFWLLLRQLPPLYTLASRIVWASVFCFLLILQKKLLPDLKGGPTGALAMALYCRGLHLYHPELGGLYLRHDTGLHPPGQLGLFHQSHHPRLLWWSDLP